MCILIPSLPPSLHRCVYVSLTLVALLVVGCILLAFMFPRSAMVSVLAINSSSEWINIGNKTADGNITVEMAVRLWGGRSTSTLCSSCVHDTPSQVCCNLCTMCDSLPPSFPQSNVQVHNNNFFPTRVTLLNVSLLNVGTLVGTATYPQFSLSGRSSTTVCLCVCVCVCVCVVQM